MCDRTATAGFTASTAFACRPGRASSAAGTAVPTFSCRAALLATA